LADSPAGSNIDDLTDPANAEVHQLSCKLVVVDVQIRTARYKNALAGTLSGCGCIVIQCKMTKATRQDEIVEKIDKPPIDK
jgi:hypothetical protein